MIWYLEIVPRNESLQASANAHREREAVELGLPGPWSIHETRGLVIEGLMDKSALAQAAMDALLDPVLETGVIHEVVHSTTSDESAAMKVTLPESTNAPGPSAGHT